ncbi:unnamed protein product [Boreogadus saida]
MDDSQIMVPQYVGDSQIMVPQYVGDSQIMVPRYVGDSQIMVPQYVGDPQIMVPQYVGDSQIMVPQYVDPWLMEEDLRACWEEPEAHRPGIDAHTEGARRGQGAPSVIRKAPRTEKDIEYLISRFPVKGAATRRTKSRPVDSVAAASRSG